VIAKTPIKDPMAVREKLSANMTIDAVAPNDMNAIASRQE
jgi:hypothetical protein